MAKVIIFAIIGTVALIVVFQFVDMSNANSIFNNNVALVSDVAEGTISASISGEVNAKSTYLVDSNITLGELIDLAKGVTSNADELAYDTDYIVEDGDSFYIAPKYNNSDVCSLDEIVKVNINDDDSETLQTISGIGSTIANSIVSYRENNGPFRRIEELKDVTGIGNATFEKIKDYVRLRSA